MRVVRSRAKFNPFTACLQKWAELYLSIMAAQKESSLLGRLLEAANFAALKHRDQRRKDPYKTPYINHPLAVAYVLWKEGGVTDLATLQAALLHDTVEDTATEEAELEAQFGDEVAAIVKECSDDKSLAKWQRKKHQVRRTTVVMSSSSLCRG